jgi:hypothetical protein
MFSKRSYEGYFMADNRNSPGPGEAIANATGLPVGVQAHRGLFEAPTITCSHCQKIVILNPTRTRERAYCAGCDHYICDNCGSARAMGAKCHTYKQFVEETAESAAKNEAANGKIILPT